MTIFNQSLAAQGSPVGLGKKSPLRPRILLSFPSGRIHSQQRRPAYCPYQQTGREAMARGIHPTERLTPRCLTNGQRRHDLPGKPTNGHKNAVLHHTCSANNVLNPVRSFTDANNKLQQVTSAEIQSAIQIGATHDNLVAQGYSLDRIGTHSLRSGGAMHLKLAGYDNDIIQKLGRWSTNTYLLYIQTQIGQLTAGVAQRMAAVSLVEASTLTNAKISDSITILHHNPLGHCLSSPSVRTGNHFNWGPPSPQQWESRCPGA
jgi:hypothetical protein